MLQTSDEDLGAYLWDPTGLVSSEVRGLFRDRLRHLPERASLTVAALTRISGDYRLAAEYLRAAGAADQPVVDLCERMAAARGQDQLRYELGRLRFAAPASRPATFLDSFEAVLNATGSNVACYVADPAMRDLFGMVLGQLGAGLSAFIENQHELPGPNARIRQGVVKTWFLPDGTRVVSKRENPLKPGRFIRELTAYQDVLRRLAVGLDGAIVLPDRPDGSRRELWVPPVLALLRDGHTSRLYSVSRWGAGVPLESLLLATPSGPQRARHLGDCRELLDFMLDRGILWGDLSPRNVLLARRGDRDVLHLVDFEKTSVQDEPLSHPQRVPYCRGQVGVEELGVLCSRDELRGVLDGYFDPDGWDQRSNEPVPFPLRPELAAVLRGRGVTRPTLGQCNRTDLEILSVRSPDRVPQTGERRYPGLVNFRVEHYLSCAGSEEADDYDRITTEVLISGRRHDCFDEALIIVTRAADQVERRFAINEVADILDGHRLSGLVSAPEAEIRNLTSRLGMLYAARADRVRFRAACAFLARDRPQ